MAEAVEIPEATDGFEKKVALSIAAVAVILAFISTKGDNAKGAGLLAATKASSQWAYFQAKSIKEHSYSLQKELLGAFPPGTLDKTKLDSLLKSYDEKVTKYEAEKEEIKKGAEALEVEVEQNGDVDDRCDTSALFLQIAIVLSSIAILIHGATFWYVSLAVSFAGAVIGATAFFL